MNETESMMERTRYPQLQQLLQRVGNVVRVACFAGCLLALIAVLYAMFGRREVETSLADWCLLAGVTCGLVLVAAPGKLAAKLRGQFLFMACATMFVFAVVEVYVRVFDPFPIVLRGGRISLPMNTERQFDSKIPGLDEQITVRFNSLGFRGPEPTNDWDERLTIVCVGGSTTQCIYLSEGTTWPDRLAEQLTRDDPTVWLNNAGLDGHSTFGHLQLLDQYLAELHPKLILFYIGLNDVDRNDLNSSDLSSLRTESQSSDSPARSIQRFLLRRSDTFALIDGFRMQSLARRKGLTHGEPIAHRQLNTRPTDEDTLDKQSAVEARSAWLKTRDPNCIAGYESRVSELVMRCRELGIDCVLITQPVLYGEGVDDVTGIDLERVQVGETDGAGHWQLLQRYNLVTAKVANDSNVPLIDLASQMPKSSRYFYDLTHYNRAGAEKAASLIYQGLKPHLSKFAKVQHIND